MKSICGWIYAIDKYGYPPSIENTLKAIEDMAKLGFKYIEIEGISIEGLDEDNILNLYENRKDIKKLCDSLGVKVLSFLPILPNLVSFDAKKRDKALELFDVGVEVGTYFGSENLYTDSFTPPIEFIGEAPYKESINFGKQFKVYVDPHFNWEEQWEIVVQSISKCNAKARKASMRLLVEPRVGEILSNTDALLRLMDRVGDDNLGVVFDTAHLHPQKEILPLSIEKLGKKVFYVHVADSDGISNKHLAIGDGTIDWNGVFAGLRKHKFCGDFVVDLGNIPNLDEQFLRAKKFIEEKWGK